ncbi:MAG: hypothetical protein FWG56_11330 [Desulfovibrionaceae bacterium]|nr:hypothetical protein [Desulfovibrionaceae bacterium]
MTRRTFGQAFDEAVRLDKEWGTQHRTDGVLCRMLDHIAHGQKPAKPTRLVIAKAAVQGRRKTTLVPSLLRPAAAPKARPQPKVGLRGWSSGDVAAALDDGVKRGRITGTTAMAALKTIGHNHR